MHVDGTSFLLCIVCALESTVTKFFGHGTNGATSGLDLKAPRQLHGSIEKIATVVSLHFDTKTTGALIFSNYRTEGEASIRFIPSIILFPESYAWRAPPGWPWVMW